MLALSAGPSHGWGDRHVWPAFAGSAALLAAFLVAQTRSAEPLLPLDLLRGPLGVAATLTLLGNALSITVGFHLPLYLEEVLRFDAARSGRWLAVMPLLALLMAPLAGRWADRLGTRVPSVAGMVLTAAGFALLSRAGASLHPVPVVGGMALIGLGLGLFSVPNTSAMMSAVPHQRLGLASGLQATVRNLGFAGGAAATAAIVASSFAAHGGGGLAASVHGGASHPLAFALATRDAYRVMTGVALFAAVLATRQPEPGRARGAV
jgi:MFS-type transporter involved in bile tolerance (Atg22 family)